jgi:hypothetical protein
VVDTQLGRLKEVCVRKVWRHEAVDFTPWLSRNLDRLSEVLDIELELEQKEKTVGTHRADIVARTSARGPRVLIENQLELTDLKHLGQILSYLAGLEAHIVIWIAPAFRADHRSAIRWLNQNTSDPYAFFAIRVKTFQIEQSSYAPTFEVLEKPNEWSQMVQRIRKSTENHRFQRDFWTHCYGRWPISLGLANGFANSRFRRWIEEADLRVTLLLREDSVRVYVTGNRDEEDEEVFGRIDKYRSNLLKSLEGSHFLRDKNPRCTTELEVNTRDRNNWDRMADWLFSQCSKYERVLRSPVTAN